MKRKLKPVLVLVEIDRVSWLRDIDDLDPFVSVSVLVLLLSGLLHRDLRSDRKSSESRTPKRALEIEIEISGERAWTT